MSFTQADLVRLERAIASGARTIEYGDRKLELRSQRDIVKARRMIAADLEPAKRGPYRVRMNTKKGVSD